MPVIWKTKKEYFGNQYKRNVNKNKAFWKLFRIFSFGQNVSNEQIILAEIHETISKDSNVAQTLFFFFFFFSNIVTNIEIPEYIDNNSS